MRIQELHVTVTITAIIYNIILLAAQDISDLSIAALVSYL